MAWKKKEKPLTPEEAIAAAKKELAPFWYNTEPLLAAVRTDKGAAVLPLNSSFVQKVWVYVFVDPTEFAGERALQIAKEWYHRYGKHGVGFIVVFRAPQPFAKGAADYLRRSQIQFPGVFDHDNLFSTAFGVQAWPAVIVQNGSVEIGRGSGANWTEDVEEKIQVYLRQSDPGLATFLPFQLSSPVVGFSRADFGSLKGKPVDSLKNVIELSGEWTESEDCISTSDPKATATIHPASAVVALIAQAGREGQITKVLLQPTDGAMMQEWAPEGSGIDENGHSVVRVSGFGFYNVLKDLPPKRRSFKLTFPDALGVPIQIYGLRFGAKG